MRIFHLKKDFLVAILILLMLAIIVLLIYTTALKTAGDTFFSFPLYNSTVVVDPGHGGYDPGVYRNGIYEKDIVMDISRQLKLYLRKKGAQVVMTREEDADFLEAGPKKMRDLEQRLKIVAEADADLMVSIHTNAMESSVWSGAQTFYREEEDASSKKLALFIQDELINKLGNTKRQAKPGNYFLLDNSPIPATIVEVGFISNPEEARLLQKPEYQDKVAYSIGNGILRYLTEDH